MRRKRIVIRTGDRVALDAIAVTANRRSAPYVVLAHGITVDREEEGAFRHLAESLSTAGFSSLRFSFRGHGRSGLQSSAMTIAGEMLDLKAAFEHLARKGARASALVAASFGAVSTSLLARYLSSRLSCAVMWNPVLDLQKTFVRPQTDWARKNFSGPNVSRVYEHGGFTIDDQFRAGVVFWEELHQLRPNDTLARTTFPLLILHGDKDSYVPYSTSAELSRRRARTTLVSVSGSDHGFPRDADERLVIGHTVRFIAAHA